MSTATEETEQRFEDILVPLLAVAVAMLIGMVIITMTGNNAFQAYGALVTGAVGSKTAIMQTIIKATPLILTGLSVAFAFRAGLFNIGATGQLIAGMLAASTAALYLDFLPRLIHWPMVLIASIIAGGVWGGIAGWLKASRGAHEVITTIMLNYIAIRLGELLLSQGGLLQNSATSNPQSPRFPESAGLTVLLRDNATVVHSGTIIALLAAALIWFVINQTTLGYRVKAVGHNPDASLYGGINVKQTAILSMVIAGALAGAAGTILTVGDAPFQVAKSDFAAVQIGFAGIAVALLGRGTVPGVILAALLFGALDSGAIEVQFSGGLQPGIATKLIEVIQGLIIFFVGIDTIFRHTVKNLTGRGGAAA